MNRLTRALAVAAALAASPAYATVLWEGDTSRGASTFEGVELQPGRFGVTSSPYGNVFYCETYDGAPGYETGKQRCEVKGSKQPDGSIWRMSENVEYYVGWRSMWNPMPTKNGARFMTATSTMPGSPRTRSVSADTYRSLRAGS